MKTLNPNEIINALKEITDCKSDSQLAELLKIDRQSIYQYKKKSSPDIQQKIISILIKKITTEKQRAESAR